MYWDGFVKHQARRPRDRAGAVRLRDEPAGAAKPDVEVSEEYAEPVGHVRVHVWDGSACGLVLAQVVEGVSKVLGGRAVEPQLDRIGHGRDGSR